MNIRQLKLFLLVAETENTTKAAKQAFISQPAVSQTIRELEEEVGIQLFDRSGRGIQLNPAGKEFYGQVRHVLNEYDQLEDFAEHLGTKSPMKLGVNLTIANFWLPEIIPSFVQEGNLLTIQADRAEAIERALIQQELDLALIEGVCVKKELQVEVFDQYELVIVTAKTHPLAAKKEVTIKEFLSYPLLLREKGSALRDTLDSWLFLHQQQVEPMMTSINSPSLLAMASTGVGITFLPQKLVEQSSYKNQLSCLRFKEKRLYNQVQLVYLPNHTFTETMHRFYRLIFPDREEQ